MSEGDLLADRKRLKHHLSAWRVIALLAMIGALAVLAQQYGALPGKKPGAGLPGKGYIAEIKVEDVIGDNPDRDALFKDIREDDDAKALIVWFDSPGGTTVGGEELYLQLKEMRKTKPVVGVMRTLCASACYMASLGADQVFARGTSLTGSIGVLLESVEVSELAKKIGVAPITITSGKFKDVPSMTKPITDEERAYLHGTIDDAYDQFVQMVAERRGMSVDQVHALADGRVYTGRQALPLHLIDGLGGMEEAKQWLVDNKKLNKDLEIEEVKPEAPYQGLFDRLSQWTNVKIFNRASIGLDGLSSIWHPSPVQ